MSTRTVLHSLGSLLIFLGATMVIPLSISIGYREPAARAFLSGSLLSLILGLLFRRLGKEENMGHREAFAIVTSSWIMVALLGGIPFWLSGEFAGYIDCVFEAMSGVTTTGATVLSNIESLPLSIVFWRSFLHWIGGMGFIVLSIAVLPKLRVGGRELFYAEVPGPVPERIQPRIRKTAATLWGIYTGLSVTQTLLLLAGGMGLFEAVVHTFGTMATGGFSSRSLSVEGFQSVYIEIVILVFMVLAGANFTLHYQVVRTGSLKAFWRSSEFVYYVLFLCVATVITTVDIWGNTVPSPMHAFRLSAFQVTSIMTTTGYTTANFDVWPSLSRTLLLVLMFIGGCAGSTGGSIKVVRIVVVIKHVYREVLRTIHPRALRYVTLDRQVIEERVTSSVVGFVLLYLVIFAVGTMILGVSGLDLASSASAVAATLGNVGPGLGAVGAYQNYADLPAAIKVFLSFLMLTGRLEIYSVMVLFLPHLWRRRGHLMAS